MGLYSDWCDKNEEGVVKKRLWKFVEKANARANIRDRLCETVRSHYDDLDRIAEDIRVLGYPHAAAVLHERLPRTPRARSGELGEILAAELVEEELEFRVPVRRLRFKDGREMALRGDDFIGIMFDNGNRLCLLKGESKSNATLGKTTITLARQALNRDSGRTTPMSLLFVADRLLDSADADDNALGRELRQVAVQNSVPANRIDHVLFTLSGNAPPAALADDLAATKGDHTHTVVNVRIVDHQAFIADIYEQAGQLGNG